MRVSDEAAERVRKIFQIMSHPVRRTILEMLEDSKGTYYNALKSWLCVPDSTLRYHLKKLTNAKFVKRSGKDYTITDVGGKILKHSKEFNEAMARFEND